MCGRFGLDFDSEFHERFKINDTILQYEPRYNIAPGQQIPVIVRDNEVMMMRWGLIPGWAKQKVKYPQINARVETVQDKPFFRTAFKSRRCLVPATNFYEWKKDEDLKIPYNIRLKNRKYFAFAGIWEAWIDPEERKWHTFAIITTTPNTLVSKIHNRMPAILDLEEEQEWLNSTDHDRLYDIAKSNPKEEMEAYVISDLVNNSNHQSKDILNPITLG